MVLLESKQTLTVNDKAPDFRLNGTDGKTYSLPSFSQAKAVLIIFGCNHCPYVKAKMAAIRELHESFASRGLQIILINSNDPVNYPDDDFEHMIQFAQENRFPFPYLVDDTQDVAKQYGAVCTPDPFLFDGKHELAWHGRLDDAMSPGAPVTKKDMAEAIEMVLQGKKVDKPFRPSMGCSIKWKE
ncbi:thioredoxin family protein [Candidatus Micrarchaeota archaeon]|nr:thioredoxin family protein [Candidatus Micrarchaeota archaeon]